MTEELSTRPEWTALRLTRRWVFVLGVAIAYSITMMIAIASWGQLTTGERVFVAASIPFFIAGVVFSKRALGLWLFLPLLMLLLLGGLVYPESSPRWIAGVLLVSYMSYIWAVLAPRWWGLIALVLGPILLLAVWRPRPTNVIAGGLALADGSLAVIQLVAATAMIWWAWNSLRGEADRTDADLAVLDAHTSESMLVTERAAMWRLTGTRLHESVLNSLRYLITSPTVDREVLRDFADVSLPTPQDAAPLASAPVPSEMTRSDISEPFNKGRLLVTAALAGNAFGGISFLAYLLTDEGAKAIPAVILGVAGSLISLIIVLRRVRIRSPWAIPIIAIPAILPWLFLSQDLGCREALVLSPILNIAGFCVMVIAAWATRAAGAIGLLTWGIGGVLIALRMPDDCRQFMAVALVNTLVALPVIITVTYAGTAAYERSRRRAMEIRQQEIRERGRAIAAVDINAQLHDVVQEAVSLISEIADGAEVDSEMRERLRLVDGQIRADMQVDPQGAGAFAVLAKSIVDSLAERGVIATVKGINSSSDQRPIDEAALDVVYRLVSAIARRSSVQVITNGREDFLSISVDSRSLAAAGLKPGTTRTFADCMIDVDLNEVTEDDAPTATVVLSRSVEE
jgi:hypothetical protein